MADSEPEADLPAAAGLVDPVSSPLLYPPAKQLWSFVWEFFGYPKNPDGSIKDGGEPTCKLCKRKVVARSANTSNLTSHLRECHKQEYAQLMSKQVRWIIINPTVAALRCFIHSKSIVIVVVRHFHSPRKGLVLFSTDQQGITTSLCNALFTCRLVVCLAHGSEIMPKCNPNLIYINVYVCVCILYNI